METPKTVQTCGKASVAGTRFPKPEARKHAPKDPRAENAHLNGSTGGHAKHGVASLPLLLWQQNRKSHQRELRPCLLAANKTPDE